MATSLHDHAVDLARAGWAVFPVDARSKRPLTQHGHLDASSNSAVVSLFWGRHPDASIATPTGNGLLVVDIDPRNGGSVPTWAPRTRTVRTQSGGLHLHYAIDEDIKSRASLFGQGVDSKCAGGYVLIPPSPGYEWLDLVDRTPLTKTWLERHITPANLPGMSHAASRLAPSQWRRGIIHDQVVAWAAYFAASLDTEAEVSDAVWAMVDEAQQAGLPIDNARGHIDTAIRWVMERESAKGGPSLA